MWNRDASSRDDSATPPGNPVSGPPAQERRVTAWVGKSVVFKGELTSSEDMTLDGRVDGTIDLIDNVLTIGPVAEIRAEVLAKTVIVMGTVSGTITASDKVEIRETGTVVGNIVARRFAMADGAVLSGRVDNHAPDDRARPAAAVALTAGD